MFNVTSDALKWLFERLRPRWFWAAVLALAGVFSVWNSIPDKYQTKLIDYGVELSSGPVQAIDVEVASFTIDGAEEDFLVWLKNKIERNLVELFVDNGKRTAHRLAVIKPDNAPHNRIEGALSVIDETAVEISARMFDESGVVLASTSFQAPRDFLKDNYKVLPETIIYGLDVGLQSLRPLETKARPTNNLVAYALLMEAKRQAGQQNYEDAQKLLDKAVEVDPRFATAHAAAAELLHAIGDQEGAKKHEARAREINLDYPKIPILAGVAEPLPNTKTALASAQWKTIAPGFEMKEVDVSGYEVKVLAWKFDPKLYRIVLAPQRGEQGSTTRELLEKNGGILAVNGGFFDIDRASRLSPSGVLVSNGLRLADYRKGAGSALVYEKDGQTAIGWSKDWETIGDGVTNAVQAGPMIVDPGGKNGIIKNDFNRHNRTAVCMTQDRQFIVTVVTGGLSLFELGAILSAKPSDGGFGCERAMNLDGGPSTQASFRSPDGKHTLEIEGTWPSQNVLLVKGKEG